MTDFNTNELDGARRTNIYAAIRPLVKADVENIARDVLGWKGDGCRVKRTEFVDMLCVAASDENTYADIIEAAMRRSEPVPKIANTDAVSQLTSALTALMGKPQLDMNQIGELIDERVAEAVAALTPTKIYVTPSGEWEPKPGQHVHAVFERVAKLAALRKNILLVGPTGCGKTALAGQTAEALKLPFASISCSAGMSESHLRGWLLPTGDAGKFEYVPSDFIRVYENGGVFLLDEIDASDENVLVVLHQALSNDGFFLPQRTANPWVKRHPDFVCIAAANTYGHGADRMYVGRNALDAATLDRFIAGTTPMDYDPKLEEALCHPEALAFIREMRAVIAQHRLQRVASTRVALDFSQMLAAGFTMDDCKASYFAGWTRDECAKAGV